MHYRLGFLLFISMMYRFAYALDNDTFLMKNDRHVVTVKDFNDYLDMKVPTAYRHELLTNGKQIKELIDQLFINGVLAKEARDLKLDTDPVIQRKIDYAVSRILAKVRLDQLEETRKPINWALLAKEDYVAHKSDHMSDEAVKVAHILISRDEHEATEMTQLAEKVLDLAKAGKMDFADLAKQYSEGPSAEKGGDLGFVSRGQMVKPFELAAFKLTKPGQISPIVKTKFGLHIIQLQEKKSASQIPFEQIKDQLIAKHQHSRAAQLRTDYLDAIRNSMTDVNIEAIKALKKPVLFQSQSAR